MFGTDEVYEVYLVLTFISITLAAAFVQCSTTFFVSSLRIKPYNRLNSAMKRADDAVKLTHNTLLTVCWLIT